MRLPILAACFLGGCCFPVAPADPDFRPGEPVDGDVVAPDAPDTPDATETEKSDSTGIFADGAAVLAGVPGEQAPIINELSGETIGTSITREGPAEVAGIPCGNTVHVYDDSWGCETTAQVQKGGYTIEPSWIGLHYTTGTITNLNADMLVPKQEQLTLGGVPCGTWAHLTPDGSLGGCALREAHPFGSITLPAETDFTLRDDGTLDTAVIYAEDFTLAGKPMKAGTFEFNPDGTVSSHNPDWFGD